MEQLHTLIDATTQLAQAAGGGFKGLLGDSLIINGQNIYEEYDSIGPFLNAIFKMSISIGGVVAVSQFVYGGLVYMMSESGAVQMGESKGRMTNAVLGLLMLLSTYIIFQQINPDMLKLSVEPVPIQANPNATPLQQ
ncbi:MAG: hypothetical protein WAX38_03740 [Minisyncoccia bacterium]